MDEQYYGGLTKISPLELLRPLASDGKVLQLDVALKDANFPDIGLIQKLSKNKAQKIYLQYPDLSREELVTLCIFAYKKVFSGNSADKTPCDSVNLSLFMRDTKSVMKYGRFILCLMCAIRQLPRLRSSEVKSLYVISELEDACINPGQNWVNNVMSWPSFTNAYTEGEAKTLVKRFRNPVLFKVSGPFCAYDLRPFSNDDSMEFIVLEPETKYLVTKITECDSIFGLKVVSVSVQLCTLVLEEFIRVIRKPPPKPKRRIGNTEPSPNNGAFTQTDPRYPQENNQLNSNPQPQYISSDYTHNGLICFGSPFPYNTLNNVTPNIITPNNVTPNIITLNNATPPPYIITPNNITPPHNTPNPYPYIIESKDKFNGFTSPQFIVPKQTFQPPPLGEREANILMQKTPLGPNRINSFTPQNTFKLPPPPPEFLK